MKILRVFLCEKMGKNIWSYLWIQRCNLKIPLLAHYTRYLSSSAAPFQLYHLLFPPGLLLFPASLAANELRYRTACLLPLFFPNVYWGAGGLSLLFFPLGRGLVVREGELEMAREVIPSLILTDFCALVKEFLVKMRITWILLINKICLLLSSMNLFYGLVI